MKICMHRLFWAGLAVSAAMSLALTVGCGKWDGQGAAQNAEKPVVPEEKKLVLYTSHKTEVYEPVVSEFEERTGIWVEVVTGGSTGLLAQIDSACAAGRFSCDVMFGGGIESYEAAKADFVPWRVRCRELLNARYVSEDDSWTPFTELPIVLIYNSKLVGKAGAPRGFNDLFLPEWKGKIAFADPATSGSSCTMLETLLQVLGGGEKEILGQFAAALDGNLSSGSGEVLEEVASGKRLVGVTLEETAKKWIARGEDLEIVYPCEGTSALPDGCAIVKGAEHPENAELFLDFIVSDDVQRYAQDYLCRRSIRTDLKQEAGGSDEKLFDLDLPLAVERRGRLLELWSEAEHEGLH